MLYKSIEQNVILIKYIDIAFLRYILSELIENNINPIIVGDKFNIKWLMFFNFKQISLSETDMVSLYESNKIWIYQK